MIDVDEIKRLIKPSICARYYLGSPQTSSSTGNWYLSPFRREKTASFCVNDEKGMRDFGSGISYDIVKFLQELYNLSFLDAVKKLANDFGINIEDSQTNKDLYSYKLEIYRQQQELCNKVNEWFIAKFGILCDKLKFEKKLLQFMVKEEALAITYKRISDIEIELDMFLNVSTYTQKEELWRYYKGEL